MANKRVSERKLLMRSKIIIGDQVLTVQLEDISTSIHADADVRKLRVDVLDENNQPISRERVTVRITECFISMYRGTTIQLYHNLIQFRKSLVEHCQTRDLFVYPDMTLPKRRSMVESLVVAYFRASPLGTPLYANYIRNSVDIEYGEILSILGRLEGQGIIRHTGDCHQSFMDGSLAQN